MTRAISGATRVFALLGHPVAHSLSPALHNAWFEAAGLDAVYVALPAPEPVTGLTRTLHALGIHGVNLTIPLKVSALAGLDRPDPVVTACGACNTIVLRDGLSHGYNTDGPGLLAALREFDADLSGIRAAILGTGGAARAAAWALTSAGAAPPTIFGRSPERAQAIATLHRGAGLALNPAAFAAIAPSLDLVIHALPAAARAAVLALPAEGLRTRCAWVDLNYFDDAPPHLTALAARGHRVQRGDRMLLHQAALAFERFTGTAPDLAVGHAVIESAARRRHG